MFILMGIILAAGAGYFLFLLFSHSAAEALTVSELKSGAVTPDDQPLRIEGRVAPGSVEWNDTTQALRFVLTDDRESLDIVYQGIAPDNFKPGAEMEIQGAYRADGTFEALSFGQPSSFCSLCH